MTGEAFRAFQRNVCAGIMAAAEYQKDDDAWITTAAPPSPETETFFKAAFAVGAQVVKRLHERDLPAEEALAVLCENVRAASSAEELLAAFADAIWTAQNGPPGATLRFPGR